MRDLALLSYSRRLRQLAGDTDDASLRKDLGEALEWAQALPAEDRQRTTRAILREVAERDPSRAAATYQDLTAALPADSQATRDFRHTAQEIASLLSSTAPRDAAVWATQLPEGAIRRGAVVSVADQWLQIPMQALRF